jgi:RND family efflux transporter MFP subunit
MLKGWRWKGLLVGVVVLGAAALFRGNTEGADNGVTAIAKLGSLPVTVLEQGSIEAIESQNIKSEVKAQTKIMSIVEEGYLVTAEDVEQGKVLVELNDSELRDKLMQQEIAVQNAYAEYTDAREQYEIQVKQNESDIKAAELESKFKRMDFEKYLGSELARQLITELGLGELEGESQVELAELYASIRAQAEALGASLPEDTDAAAGEEATQQAPAAAPPKSNNGNGNGNSMIELTLQSTALARPKVDFAEYATPGKLKDGDAQQKLRQLEDDLLIAKNELTQAQTQVEGTRRLAEKGFVTQSELDKDETSLERSDIKVQSSETARQLFIRYEFPKEAEKLLSEYEESLRKLVRAKKQAISKLSQAETKMLTQRVQLDLQVQQRDELQEQIDKCHIAAQRVGLVVYGSQNRNPWDNAPTIEVGAEVWEGFEILTIPDMSEMSAKVNIHESDIKKINNGQQVRVRLEAFPDRELSGQVTKVAVLPDSGNRWMRDEKLYPVTVHIEGMHDWLKPGMTAEVEIIIEELKDVLSVPLQAVFGEGDSRVCYVVDGLGKPQRRPVTTGQFNESFIQITEGLAVGDEVLLRAPALEKEEKPEDEENAPENEESTPEAPQEVAEG